MDCAEIRAILLASELPAGAGAEQHLAGCAPCRELVASHAVLGRGLAALEPQGEFPAVDFEALSQRLSQERGVRAWLRSRSTLARVAMLLWVALGVLTYFVLTRRRLDWELYPVLRLNLLFALFGVGAFVALSLALRGPLRRGHRRDLVLSVLVLSVPALAALLPRAHVAHSASLQGTISNFGERALYCFGTGFLASAPIAILVLVMSREDRVSPLSAAFAAAAAGFAANLALHAHCAITDPEHLLLGHALLGLVWLVGFLALGRLSRAR